MSDVAAGAPISLLAPPTPPARPEPTPEVRAAAEHFESMVLAQLLQPMFAALDTQGLGGGGFGEEIFRPMLVDEYARSLSRSGGIGLAQSIMDELMRVQMAQTPVTTEAADGADR